jgi:hypothetical protein
MNNYDTKETDVTFGLKAMHQSVCMIFLLMEYKTGMKHRKVFWM